MFFMSRKFSNKYQICTIFAPKKRKFLIIIVHKRVNK